MIDLKKGFTSDKQSLDYIIEQMYELRYRLESGGVSHFMNEAQFTNKSTNKVSKGYANSGIGSPGEIDGNMGFLHV